MSFLDNIGEFPCDTTYCDKLMDLVSTLEYWTKAMFDVKCKTLQKAHDLQVLTATKVVHNEDDAIMA